MESELKELEKERRRLYELLETSIPDWMRSKINNELHNIWIKEELIKSKA